MNELLLLVILLISIVSLLMIINRNSNFLMNMYIIFTIVISYILSFRNISFIGMNINADIVLYSAIIPIFYYYIEKNKNIKETDILIKNIIILLISMLLIMLTTGYIPSVTDNNAINIQNTFGINYINLLSYPITLTLSIYLMLKLKEKLKDIYSSNFNTLIILGSIVTAVDLIVYNITTYSLTQPLINIIFIITVSYIIRIIIIIFYSIIIEKNLPKKKVKK